MKLLFFLSVIYTAVEVNTDLELCNTINICKKHLQMHFSRDNYELLNLFMNTIFDDNCILENWHIDICKTLLNHTCKCEKCVVPLTKPKITCTKCKSLSESKPSCANCNFLFSLSKQLEIYKLCLRKFILRKYSQETVKYFLEKMTNEHSRFIMMFILSGISFTSKELIILTQVFSHLSISKGRDNLINNEVSILNIFCKHHFSSEKKDLNTLYDELFQENTENVCEYLLYIALRFNLSFYTTISSQNLLNLILAFTSKKFGINSTGSRLSIFDAACKTRFVGFVMDREDFYKLLDFFIDDSLDFRRLSYFLQVEGYVEMLTEEKAISILMKIFKIKTICPLENSRTLNSSENVQNDDELSIKLDRIRLYNQFIEITDRNEPKFTKAYNTYQNIFKMIINRFAGFTPNGIIKIIYIILHFLNKETNTQIIFEDLLKILCSRHKTYEFTVENVLEIMDLLLKYEVPFDSVNRMIDLIFNNIESGDELDKIFDHVITYPRGNFLLGIFVKLYGTKNLSEPKLNELFDYLISNLNGETKNFFTAIGMATSLSINFQKKYIQRMIVHRNIKNFDFLGLMSREIFDHFSKNELSTFFEFIFSYKRLRTFIVNFIEYLSFDQLRRMDADDLENIRNRITQYDRNLHLNFARYLSSPFLYYDTSFFFYFLGILFIQDQDPVYQSTIFNSILNDPILQKCIDDSQMNQPSSNMFENAYIKHIAVLLGGIFDSHRDLCLLFYENLSLDLKFIFKGTIIQCIFSVGGILNNNHCEIFLDDKSALIENIFNFCHAFSPNYKEEKVKFFLENFNSSLYRFASQELSASFKRVILDLDFEHLIQIFDKIRIRHISIFN